MHENEIETFYKQVEQAQRMPKQKDVAIIMSDLNANIGNGRVGKLVVDFGLRDRNERGDRWLQFYQENSLIISNTFFQSPAQRLYIWKAPSDKLGKVVRNQTDYMLIIQRYRNAYPGADVTSDDNPLVSNLKLKYAVFKINFK